MGTADGAVLSQLSTEHTQLVAQFLAEHGEEALRDAMRCGVLFANLRQMSRFSVHTAVQAAANGLPVTLLYQFRPGAAKRGEQVEARLLTGEAHQFVMDFRAS